ncbi:hypothetical protein [Paenibacillus tengchongensis]|uniref:hypothetical protein n=1 Tax=Paenibacillus tengchongensis TaxID=2608684 RepID=UPI00124E4013|nr:hypothetical protein [Paenibacillus tengchongensis]
MITPMPPVSNASGRRAACSRISWRLLAGLLALLLLAGRPGLASADWDSSLREIESLYAGYTALQESIKDANAQTAALRKQNNAARTAVNAAIKAADAAVLGCLKSEAEALRKRHAPLLEQYTSLGKDITAARKTKNLQQAALLEIRRNKLKAATAAAQAEIKAKNTELAQAKASAAAKVKPSKDALVPIAALKKQIIAGIKQLSAAAAERKAADKTYKTAVSSGDAVSAAGALKLSCAKMQNELAIVRQLYAWEQQITGALRAAEAKLPS